MTTLIVHGGLPSPFVRKVLICLEEKRVPYELRQLAPFPKTPGAAGARTRSGGFPSCRTATSRCPTRARSRCTWRRSTRRLRSIRAIRASTGARCSWRSTPIRRSSRARRRRSSTGLIRPWFFKQPGDLALADKAIAEELGPSLDWLEPRVDAPTGIVAGRYSIADIAVASQLVSLRYARRELDAERWPRIAAWFEATRARPAWKELAPKEVPPL